jgi:ActR/RegA family two-component response regulator
MDRVLLLDRDEEHAAGVAEVLQTVSCYITICSELKDTISLLHSQAFAVVVVVTRANADWSGLIESVRHAALPLPDPPQIVCLIRGPYRGPDEKVYAARRGFTVIYER